MKIPLQMLAYTGLSLSAVLLLAVIFLSIKIRRLRTDLEVARMDFRDTLRKQHGMTFKFTKEGGRFVHTFCEGQLARKLGAEPSDVVGKYLEEFIPDTSYVECKEAFYERAWNGEEVSYEGQLNGVWYVASLRPVRKNGQVSEVIASCVDITEQKRSEQVLRENEQMYRLIAESSTDLIRILEPDMTIRYASPSHEQVLGFSPEELIGKTCDTLVFPEDRERVATSFTEMLGLKGQYLINFRLERQDGAVLAFETRGRPVLDKDGNVTSVVVVSRDMSARLKAEDEIRRNDKLALAGQLAAGIAHEIRNPLTAIKGFVQLLRNPSESQQYYTDIVLSELNRVESIVNELLVLAKPEPTQFQIQDVRMLLSDVTTLLDSQAILKKVQIHLDIQCRRAYVIAVENQLKQVFINVIKNAIESMPGGGDVYVTVTEQDAMIIISVLDEGPGISGDDLPRLGEPFYTTKDSGTGLGLMVSYKIVKNHGGNINIKSTVGEGTNVTIELPAASALVSQVEAASS